MGLTKIEKQNQNAFMEAYAWAFKINNWRKAFPIWKDLAEKGYRRSAFYTGVCFDTGQGTGKNRKQAYTYYCKAGLLGHSTALYNLYIMCRDGVGTKKDIKKAVQWLKTGERTKDPDILGEIGFAYHEGMGLKKDLKKAAKYYLQAARKGYKQAQWNLHLCYEFGEGVGPSKRWSLHWLRKAAKNGNIKAEEKLKTINHGASAV